MNKLSSVKEFVKKRPTLMMLVKFFYIFKSQRSFILKLKLLRDYFKDFSFYKKTNNNNNFVLRSSDLFPRIYDKTKITPVDPTYFFRMPGALKKYF